MKKTLLPALLCGIFINNLFATDIPFPTKNAVWNAIRTDSVNYMTYTGGDTIINDTTYTKIYRSFGKIGYDQTLKAMIRTEGKKVYARNFFETREEILYDFGLKVGDVIRFCFATFIFSTDYQSSFLDRRFFDKFYDYICVVKEIRSITTLDGINRKLWVIAISHPFHQNDLETAIWVEGIGDIKGIGILNPMSYMKDDIVGSSIDPPKRMTFNCFNLNNQTVYIDTASVQKCPCGKEIIIRSIGNAKADEVAIVLTKKGEQAFTIETKTGVIAQFTVLDLLGHTVCSSKNNDAKASFELPTKQGVYILTGQTTNGQRFTQKIMIK